MCFCPVTKCTIDCYTMLSDRGNVLSTDREKEGTHSSFIKTSISILMFFHVNKNTGF